jgi:hypothetical protein
MWTSKEPTKLQKGNDAEKSFMFELKQIWAADFE